MAFLDSKNLPAYCKLDYQEIRKTAYFKWEATGRPEGRDMEFWLRAETEYARTHGLWDWESGPFKVGDDFYVEVADGTCQKVPKPDGGDRSPPNSFLGELPTSKAGLRQDLWKLFQAAVAHAKRLTPAAVEIVSVSVCGPEWQGGRIKIPVETNDKGVIFHEVGHSFFEASRFHKDRGGSRNDWWGDAFCDAFRYCLEIHFCPGSRWLRDFPNETDGRYQYPASLILAKTRSKDFDGLITVWADLLVRYDLSDDFLDREFGYPMRPPESC